MPSQSKQAIPGADDPGELRIGPTIRQLRKQAGWSLQRLADEAGISSAAVFKVEKGRMVPSVNLLLKIANALGRPIGALLGDTQPPTRAAVVRLADRQEFRFAEIPVAVQRLSGRLAHRKLEVGVYVVEPGATSTPEALTHAGEEVYYVLEGRIRFEVDGRTEVLEAGDALHLEGTVPHRWANAAEGQSRLLFVLTPPPFRDAPR